MPICYLFTLALFASVQLGTRSKRSIPWRAIFIETLEICVFDWCNSMSILSSKIPSTNIIKDATYWLRLKHYRSQIQPRSFEYKRFTPVEQGHLIKAEAAQVDEGG